MNCFKMMKILLNYSSKNGLGMELSDSKEILSWVYYAYILYKLL